MTSNDGGGHMVKAESVHKHFGKAHVLKGVDFEVEPK